MNNGEKRYENTKAIINPNIIKKNRCERNKDLMKFSTII